ncbi:MAG: pyridoxamine 5'-phosphate oxidase family protein [Promethearchaeota archaeon]|nr:MAG: pyridoxamine 5'-phosphate oxidase family protein [Candidatus Lokiarchaeota archaeon]
MSKLIERVKDILKDNMWLVISTVDEKNQPHSSVVIYQSDGEDLYIQTGSKTLKAKNIKRNNKVSITIPFRKNLLHKIIPAPPAELHFTAIAKEISKEDEKAREILGKFVKDAEKVANEDKTVWFKIIPSNTISTYGVGVPVWYMRKPEKARNIITLK